MEKNLGHATAYGYAKSKGYSGTEEEFAELMADYASVGQSAAQSAEQAAASATSASGSAAAASQAAQTATSKASEAVTAAGTATTKASEASTSADTASTAAQTATNKASEATTAATTATTKASEANQSAQTATTAKTDAETARDAAAQSASQAAESARTLTIDATLTQTGQAADAKATGDEIFLLKSDLTAVENMTDLTVHITDWTMGRRSTGALNDYYYSSNDIIQMPAQLYFDDTNYKISYVQCNADGTENIGYGSSWKTTSPATLSKTGSYDYCWIEIKHAVAQASITDSELEDVKANMYYIVPIPIVETIKQALTSAYVDGVNGLDTNDGSSAHPYKTIGKAVDSGRNTIFVANGTYNEFVFIRNREKLAILPWAYPNAFDSSVPDTPKIVITGTQSKPIACAIRAYDCGELTLVGIHGCNTTLSAFELFRNKKIEVVNCWASDVTDSEWNGFKISSCNGVFRNCQAWNIGRDGFGISIYGNTQFIDCVAHDCGDDGVSHHDGCTGAVIGGEYYNCAKGGVASPTYGSYIDVINVYSHDNVYGLYSVTDSTRRRSKAKVSGCVFKNNTGKDIYINNNDLVGWNNVYDSKSLINQATFTEY